MNKNLHCSKRGSDTVRANRESRCQLGLGHIYRRGEGECGDDLRKSVSFCVIKSSCRAFLDNLAQRNLRWTRSFFVLKSYSCSVATFSEMIWIKPIDEKLCYIYNTVVKRITWMIQLRGGTQL